MHGPGRPRVTSLPAAAAAPRRVGDPQVCAGPGAFKARRTRPLSPASRPFLLARSATSVGPFDRTRSLIGPAGHLPGTVSQ